MKLKGKTAVITGGSRGIGKATAKMFVKEGAQVAITSYNRKNLMKAQEEIGDVYAISGNIKNVSDVKKIIKKTHDKLGRIDILVNNAGIFPKIKPLHKISEREWNEIIDVNLTGQFRFTKEVLPIMMKQRSGSIINLGSDAGLKAFENFEGDAYTASKGALVLLTKAWAIEYAKYKIRVNCVCPAVVETDMTKDTWLSSQSNKKIAASEHPLGRIGTPDDVAKAILYFASDDSSWTTGSVLAVDGGISAK